ncbi:MAG TPA: cyclase family protein, partial [Pseudolabrys sp.]|nr:cyclase family protein [Pseudolabrys sp.]
MAGVREPGSGLEFYDLSHPWGFGIPVWPGYEGVRFEQGAYHARHGTLTQRFGTVMHASTHVNAPVHLLPMASDVADIPVDRFFGPGIVLPVPKGKWELIEADDLEAVGGKVRAGDIVIIATGWHRLWSDSYAYFGEAPGLALSAAKWLIERKVKLVGIDAPAIDHPLATSLGPHRNGPLDRRVVDNFKRETGQDPKLAFPDWNPAHRALLAAGIPTIEEVGGEVAALAGKRATFCAFPWRWTNGDASIVRLVGIVDTNKSAGESAGPGAALHDLTHPWGHDVSFWPGKNPIHEFRRLYYHARDGMAVQHFTTVMHRGTHMDAPIHVLENMPDISQFPLWRFFGTGVAVSIPKGRWEVITAKDLENATPRIERGDIVMINTGSHRICGDNPDYYAYSPGLYKEAAEWLVERGVKMVGIDVQALDHPLGTYLGPHGPGPIQPHLNDEYRAETGRNILDDFPLWEPAHKTLLSNGIPGIENIGGALDDVTGQRCTFMAFPWRWTNGDGSGVRVVAIGEAGGRVAI